MKHLYRIISFSVLVIILSSLTYVVGSILRNKSLNTLLITKIDQQFNHFSYNFQTQVWNIVGDKIYDNVTKQRDETIFPTFEKYFLLITKHSNFYRIGVQDLKSNIIIANNKKFVEHETMGIGDLLSNLFIDNFDADHAVLKTIDNAARNKMITKSKNKYYYLITEPLKVNQNYFNAVLYSYYDITVPINHLNNVLFYSSMMIGFTMSLIIFILGTYSIKLQKIIVKQIQTNSELEEAKLRAEESSKQKSLFLANMSHELRTPLNAIIGFSEIIKSESLGPIEIVQYKEYGNDINSSGTHLLSIINDILDFSKAESDKLQIDNIQLDLTKLIKQTMRIIADRAERAGVSVVDQTGEEHVIINGDPKRLKQVILNILSNAIKFTSEEGEIILRIVAQKEKVLLEIKDSGIGIESKDIAKVMSPFEQVDSQHSRRHDGTGLGLPLSKKLVELMKGTFQIESEIGIGTTVKLYFNIAA